MEHKFFSEIFLRSTKISSLKHMKESFHHLKVHSTSVKKSKIFSSITFGTTNFQAFETFPM